ncbi:hypothetical protein KM043_007521 [Ampulex compressa]|nr:hypothetical protein KM043_007521 [Ampulex compressa]
MKSSLDEEGIARSLFYGYALITIMAVDIKLTRSNSQSWGFRLSGGVDFSFPLTVVRVTVGGLADKAGVQAGDVVVKLNGDPLQQLTHNQAHDRLVAAGNDFVISVMRDKKFKRIAQHE